MKKLNSFSIVSLILLASIMVLDVMMMSDQRYVTMFTSNQSIRLFIYLINFMGLYVNVLALYSNLKTK